MFTDEDTAEGADKKLPSKSQKSHPFEVFNLRLGKPPPLTLPAVADLFTLSAGESFGSEL